jgi:hypothetical protein
MSRRSFAEYEIRRISILEIVQAEKFVAKTAWNQCQAVRRKNGRLRPGPLVVKALYNYPTTRDLFPAVPSTPNLRLIYG